MDAKHVGVLSDLLSYREGPDRKGPVKGNHSVQI